MFHPGWEIGRKAGSRSRLCTAGETGPTGTAADTEAASSEAAGALLAGISRWQRRVQIGQHDFGAGLEPLGDFDRAAALADG